MQAFFVSNRKGSTLRLNNLVPPFHRQLTSLLLSLIRTGRGASMNLPRFRLSLAIVTLASLSQTSCATLTTPPYRAYALEGGNVEIEAVDGEKEVAARFASQGAEHYCAKKGKEPVYIARPEPVYQGPIDEAIVSGIKTAGRVVRALGQGGDNDPSESISDNDDYKVKYLIRCQ
jgi:hypothetical protein